MLLDAEAYEAIRFLSIATKTSMSSVIADVVHTVAPVLQRTAEAVAAARKAQRDQKDGLRAAVEEAQRAMGPFHFEFGAAGERQLSLLEAVARAKAAPAIAAAAREPRERPRAAARVAPESDPRASNTGVRSPRRKALKGKKKGDRKRA